MKMRTLGRHHTILHHLREAKPRIRADLGTGIGGSDAGALQALLERGLVDRMPRNTRTRGWYVITNAGKKAYETLEAKQAFRDDLSDEITNRHWYNAEFGETMILMSTRNIAHRGYVWVEVECPMSDYWTKYFEIYVW